MRGWILSLGLASLACADTILCKDKRKIEGKIVEESDAGVKIAIKNGSVTIPRYLIEKIEYGATSDEIYQDRHSRIAAGDWKAMLELAKWCDENKLKKQATQEYGRVVELNPDCVEARTAMGHVKHDGVWMTFEDSCRARGMVEFDGEWMSAEQAKLRSALKEQKEIEKAINDRVKDCLRRISGNDIEARAEAREQLDAIPAELKFGPLLDNVDNKNAEVRAFCIGSISTLGRPEALPRVARRVLVDESEAIRSIAFDALKTMNHPDTWMQIQKGLSSEASYVRIRAANALVGFPNEGASEALLNVLVRISKPRTKFEFGATEADPRLAGDPKLTPEARKALEDAQKNPNGGMTPLTDPAEKAKEEQVEKEKAALVKALEACTGLNFGNDLAAWQAWYLRKHAATAAGTGDKDKELPVDPPAPPK